jgi:hypothetical protein
MTAQKLPAVLRRDVRNRKTRILERIEAADRLQNSRSVIRVGFPVANGNVRGFVRNWRARRDSNS